MLIWYVKLLLDVAVFSPTVTRTSPVPLPSAGTLIVSVVAVAVFTVAAVLFSITTLLAGVGLKFVPVIVIVSSVTPEAGAIDAMVGVVEGVGRGGGGCGLIEPPLLPPPQAASRQLPKQKRMTLKRIFISTLAINGCRYLKFALLCLVMQGAPKNWQW
jgi:hypothetical protein